MRWFLDGEIGDQMESFIDCDYCIDDTEILEIAKNAGIPSYQDLIAEQEAEVQLMLNDRDRDYATFNRMTGVVQALAKNYAILSEIKKNIKLSENFLKKNS